MRSSGSSVKNRHHRSFPSGLPYFFNSPSCWTKLSTFCHITFMPICPFSIFYILFYFIFFTVRQETSTHSSSWTVTKAILTFEANLFSTSKKGRKGKRCSRQRLSTHDAQNLKLSLDHIAFPFLDTNLDLFFLNKSWHETKKNHATSIHHRHRQFMIFKTISVKIIIYI